MVTDALQLFMGQALRMIYGKPPYLRPTAVGTSGLDVWLCIPMNEPDVFKWIIAAGV